VHEKSFSQKLFKYGVQCKTFHWIINIKDGRISMEDDAHSHHPMTLHTEESDAHFHD
jgi:hypothetical protein